jgi:hypothetical protein
MVHCGNWQRTEKATKRETKTSFILDREINGFCVKSIKEIESSVNRVKEGSTNLS